MANNVFAVVLGGQRQEFSGVSNVGDVRQRMGLNSSYQATLNGRPVSDSEPVQDYNFISFAEKVKGGQ